MDPNATLRRMRQLACSTMSREEADELQTLFHALDEWLYRGGFLPDSWSRDPVERAVVNSLGGDEEPDREPSAEQERSWNEQYDGTSFGA